jgi:hypothetical protein
MKVLSIFLLLFLLCLPMSAQTDNILRFYHYADSCSAFPSTDKVPEIMCKKKLGDFYVTFIGFRGEGIARIAAITKQPIDDPAKDISFTVDFDRSTGFPTAGKVPTWGYIFDRNNDGKVDYAALVGGAGPFEEDDFPAMFPTRGNPLANGEIEFLVAHCKLIFNHIADDNFDGKADAAVNVDLDSARDWVARKILVRSSKSNGVFDDVRGFRSVFAEAYDTIPHTPDAVPYRPVGKPPGNIDAAYFSEKTAILTMINEAITLCKLKVEQIAHRKKQE